MKFCVVWIPSFSHFVKRKKATKKNGAFKKTYRPEKIYDVITFLKKKKNIKERKIKRKYKSMQSKWMLNEVNKVNLHYSTDVLYYSLFFKLNFYWNGNSNHNVIVYDGPSNYDWCFFTWRKQNEHKLLE